MVQAATTPTWAKPIPTYGATADPPAFPQRTLSCSYQPASPSHICPGLLPTTRTHVRMRMHMGARTRMLARRWTSLRLARPCGAPPALGRVGHRPMPFGHYIACWVLHAILYRQRWNALDIVMLCMRSRIAALRSSARSPSVGRACCMSVRLHTMHVCTRCMFAHRLLRVVRCASAESGCPHHGLRAARAARTAHCACLC